MSYSAPDSDILYLTSLTTSGIAGYATLEKPPMTAGAEVELSQAVASSDGEVLMKAFVSPALGIESIPVGDFDFSIYGAVSAMDGVSEIVCRLYQRTLQGVETELFNFTTGEIDATTDSPTLYPVTYSTSDIIDTAITDRLVLKMYAKTDYATGITVSLFYLGETHQSRMFLPVNISKITGGDMLAALYDSNQDGMATSAAPANPLTALGDIIYGGDSDGTQTRLPIGTPGHRLTATSDGIVDWEAVTALVNPMTALGDLIYASDSDGASSRLGIGTPGYVLTSTSDGIPDWLVSGAGIKLDDLAPPDDNTDLNSSTDAHGLFPKLNGSSDDYMNGKGEWGGNIYSGTYTATLYNTTNVSASSSTDDFQYTRVGKVVTVSGILAIDTTSAAATVIGISLPIPSAFVYNGDLGGVGSFTTESARIYADTANARAIMGYTSANTASIQWSIIFSYVIK